MKAISFGSLNIDHVYNLTEFVCPGETTLCNNYQRFAGGKGANQSVALKLAGVDVRHAGKLGADGLWLKSALESYGIDTSIISISEQATGHAIIQVDHQGENCIIIHGGANHDIDDQYIDKVLGLAKTGDWIILQNEINNVPSIISGAHRRGLPVVFSPAPFTPQIHDYPLSNLHLMLLNQTEGEALTGKTQPDTIVHDLHKKHPHANIVLTLGKEGVLFTSDNKILFQPSFKVEAIDATGAGDCFAGYLVAHLMRGTPRVESIKIACAAAALSVTQSGAMKSFPQLEDVKTFLIKQ